MSLHELGAAAGVSAGSLSQIENGSGNPSLSQVRRIAGALNVDAADLLSPAPPSATKIVRAAARPHRFVPGAAGFDAELLTPGIAESFSVSHIVLNPGEDRPTASPYTGDICFLLWRGTVRAEFEDTAVEMSEGASLSFTLPRAHRFVNHGSDPAELLGVFSPTEAK
jgi:transcriptional regulator with XRE-family HTH domain